MASYLLQQQWETNTYSKSKSFHSLRNRFSHSITSKTEKIHYKNIWACALEFSVFLLLWDTFLCQTFFHLASIMLFFIDNLVLTRFYYRKYLAFHLEIWKRSLDAYGMRKDSSCKSLCNYYLFSQWMKLFCWLITCFAKNIRTKHSPLGI